MQQEIPLVRSEYLLKNNLTRPGDSLNRLMTSPKRFNLEAFPCRPHPSHPFRRLFHPCILAVTLKTVIARYECIIGFEMIKALS